MRINTFDHFRGIAILFIIAAHCYGPWEINTFYEKVLITLFTNSTIFFVFISGFFFHYVFYQNFQYKQFLIKKTKAVFLPYLILTSVGFLFFVLYLDAHPYKDSSVTDDPYNTYEYIKLYLHYLFTGRILVTYWYIPFIFIIFAASPLFIKQIQLSSRIQIALVVILLCLSTLAHRPEYNLSPIHSIIYFTPVYMMGIVCSINRIRMLIYLKGKSIILGLLVAGISIAQILLFDKFNNYHKAEIFSYKGIDFFIIQKIFMIFFVLSLLQKLENKKIPILKYLASVSFALYFIHPWVLFFLYDLSIIKQLYFLPGFLVFVITVILVVTLSIIIATMFKYIFRKKSQFLIGW